MNEAAAVQVNNPAAIRAQKMTLNFGAEVSGVDLAKPLSPEAVDRILEYFHRYHVIFFRGQHLTPERLTEFGSHFGELEIHDLGDYLLPHLKQVRILSNEVKDGRAVGATRAGLYWHSRLLYREITAQATLLYGVDCPPEGANTDFADMCAAYEALPEERKNKLKGLQVVVDRNYRYSEFHPTRPPLTPQQLAAVPPVQHPLVRLHPVTKQPGLYACSAGLCSHIVGMDIEEGRALIRELEEFATQPRFTYSHKWKNGDLLIWDNRCTLHRATPFDPKYRRTMHRIQVNGERPISV